MIDVSEWRRRIEAANRWSGNIPAALALALVDAYEAQGRALAEAGIEIGTLCEDVTGLLAQVEVQGREIAALRDALTKATDILPGCADAVRLAVRTGQAQDVAVRRIINAHDEARATLAAGIEHLGAAGDRK